MGDTPGALQLRLLQTVVDVAAEKNSTLVMPFPVELLRFFDHAANAAAQAPAATATATGTSTTPAGPVNGHGTAPTTEVLAALTALAPEPPTDPAPGKD
jgi:hypothetical protein